MRVSISCCVRLTAGMLLILAAIVVFPSASLAEENNFKDMTYPQLVKRVYEVQKLLKHSYDIKVVESDKLDAWTIEPGVIFITGGLLRFCESDDEVAGILAHEIGHHECRHFDRAREDKAGMQWVVDMYAQQAAKNPEYYDPKVFKTSVEVGVGIGRISFGHKVEYEADRAAYIKLLKNGKDPLALSELFKRLAKKLGDSKLLALFKDHPALSHRVERFARIDEERLRLDMFIDGWSWVAADIYRVAIDDPEGSSYNYALVRESKTIDYYILWPKGYGLAYAKSLKIDPRQAGCLIILARSKEGPALSALGVLSDATVRATTEGQTDIALWSDLKAFMPGQKMLKIFTWRHEMKKGKPTNVTEFVTIKLDWPKGPSVANESAKELKAERPPEIGQLTIYHPLR